jgi:hypothetical protein
MIQFEKAGSVPAIVETVSAKSISAIIGRARKNLESAEGAAQVLEAKDVGDLAYTQAKKLNRMEAAKGASDQAIAAGYRLQADALELVAESQRKLADEYDGAVVRGELAKQGKPVNIPDGNVLPTAADIGITPKIIHEARQVRDAEVADPGVVRRSLDEKIHAGQEPTKAALREAVTEAAMRGLRGSPAPSNKNPLYRAPTKAGAAWTHLYGTCRGLVEWATNENELLALHGRAERTDDQAANLAAVRKAADFLNKFLENVDA